MTTATVAMTVAVVCLFAGCDEPDTGARVPEGAASAPSQRTTAATAETMRSRIESAERNVLAGEYDLASQEIEAVFDELRSGEHYADELVANAHYVRGLCRTELGDTAGAISDLERARELDRNNADPRIYSMSTEALAAAYDYAERYADAERLFRELAERTRADHGTESAEHGRALTHLGINLDFQGRCTDATPVLLQATEILSRVAPNETALDGAWNALGNCAYQGRRLQEALGYYERSLALRGRIIGSEHPRIATVRHNLARVLMELGRRPEALEHARAAVLIRARALPPDHPWRRETEALYAELGGRLPPVANQ